MTRLRVIYDETDRQMKEVGWWGALNVDGWRKATSGSLRYCLQDKILFLPKDEKAIIDKHRLCWGTFRAEEVQDCPWLAVFDEEVPIDPQSLRHRFSSLAFGTRYSRRHWESPGGRTRISEFVAQSLIDKIAKNSDALLSVSKTDFESLIAELFVRRGFEVDLFRPTKDDGIDFLAIKNDDVSEPLIFAVQAKHPDKTNLKGKRSVLPVPTVREIYGVAKAWNLHGAIAITSNRYSPEAKKFADRKLGEIEVVDASTIHNWIQKYRWNIDE